MKVLMINSFHYLRGGAETCYFELSGALRSRGIEVIHFSMHHPQNRHSEQSDYFVSQIDYPAALRQRGIRPKLETAERAVYSREARDRIKRVIAEQKPDLAHLHGFIHEMSTSILPPLKTANLPTVQTLHDFKLRCPNTSFVSSNKICERCKGHRYYNAVLHKCKRGSLMASFLAAFEMYFHEIAGLYEPNIDLFIAPSSFLQRKMREHGVKKEIVNIPNFVDLNQLKPTYNPENYCLYVGRLVPGKGLDVLLEAYTQVAPHFPLYIAGSGELKDVLEEMARAKGLSHVHFLGHLGADELGSYLRQALFTILPSTLYENNPMSILEAFASGTPAIGSNLGGIIELIGPNQTGLLFEAGNAQDLAEKINHLVANRDLALEMGRRGREQVEATNSLEHHLERTMELYERLLQGNREARATFTLAG